ncbi:alpha/beta hydrolase [Hoyosella subflava]|nr:alpha/beta hydrolase [Hoyosella subflava]
MLALLLGACLFASACGAVPSNRPDVAIDYGPPPAGTRDDPIDGTPPELEAPQTAMRWQDCTATVLAHYNLDIDLPGVTLECVSFAVPSDPDGQVAEWLNIGLTRARLAETPEDVAPLVLTTGASQPASRALATMVETSGAILAERPIVAVDRRGTGLSDRVSCFTRALEEQQIDLGAGTPGRDPVDAAATVGRDSTLACTDHIEPLETLFTATNAAHDLDALRDFWGVDTLAVAGVGNGAVVALAYAALFPSGVSRLVIDSAPAVAESGPSMPGADSLAVAAQQAEGAEAALGTFGSYCQSIDCPLGPDPLGEIRSLLERAATGEAGPLTPGAVVTAILGSLGESSEPPNDRMERLAQELAAARGGTADGLIQLSYDMHSIMGDDGQFIGQCSDATTRAVPENIRELLDGWRSDYPHVGEVLALRQLLCAAWPAIDPVELPDELSAPTLLAEGENDPWSGRGTSADLRGSLLASGAPTFRLGWQGMGHGVLLHSQCGAQLIAAMITNGRVPEDNTCPA